MKKRHIFLANMNRNINLSIEQQKPKLFNPWTQQEKEWNRKKAADMPLSLTEKCAQQDQIEKERTTKEKTIVLNENPKPLPQNTIVKNVNSISATKTKPRKRDTSQPKISFGINTQGLSKKRKYVVEDIYCDTIINIPIENNTSMLFHEKIAKVDLDFHMETTSQIGKFIQQKEIPMLLITGQHGCGKSWCVDKALSLEGYEGIKLDDICDPDIVETNIRSTLLNHGIKKKVVILDNVDEMSDCFITKCISILKQMLMPLKDVTRKNQPRIQIIPNLVIMTAVSQYSKNVRKFIQCFGLITTKITKTTQNIQVLNCKPMAESQILKLIAKTNEVIDVKEIKKLTQYSVDCNYICSQMDMIQIEKKINNYSNLQHNNYSIDAHSNVDIFKMCQSLLSGNIITLEKIEKQWEKAGEMVSNMIYNSFLNFISNLETGIDISEVYSTHDLFPNDPDKDGCANLWENETLYDSYQLITKFGLAVALKNTNTKRGKIDMFATSEKPTMKHNRLNMNHLETYLFMNEMSHSEQYIQLNEDVMYKQHDDYKLSKVDFGRETLDANYYYDALDELEKEPKKKTKTRNFEILPVADLIKRLSHVYKI